MTAMPCGQKKRMREMIQSQMVTPPLAAMEGTTFRLKTATTKRRTRSRRPRARIRWGWAGWVVVDKLVCWLQRADSSPGFRPVRNDKSLLAVGRDSRGRLSPHEPFQLIRLVRGQDRLA